MLVSPPYLWVEMHHLILSLQNNVEIKTVSYLGEIESGQTPDPLPTMYFKLPGEVSTQCVGQAIQHYFWQIGLESIWWVAAAMTTCMSCKHLWTSKVESFILEGNCQLWILKLAVSQHRCMITKQPAQSCPTQVASLCDAAWSGSPTIYAGSRIFIYSSATQLWPSRVNYSQHCEVLGLWFSPCSLATIRHTLQTSQPWSMRLHTIHSTQFPCCYKFYRKPPHLS